MDFETVIGLEIHVQLQTKSKIFSTASATYGARPNTHIDPVTLGLPGALPVTNKQVVEDAIMLGLATNCEIRRVNRFARKHYFYPDLPKGYQISQFEEPICERGYITLRGGETMRTIGITRIHMEEDAGKSTHYPAEKCSLVDLNRAGVPLLEVVTEPDIRSPAEAAACVRALRQIVCWLGIGDGNMEEGSLRCDANVSLREKGTLKFGTRTEIKNLNSFRFIEKAIEYEVLRQLKLLKSGDTITQETRLFDSESGVTRSMRGKEESSDYRYFPDPDLPPIVIEESWKNEIAHSMPALPETHFKNLLEVYGLSPYDAGVLLAEKEVFEYFEAVLAVCNDAKAASNWITSELFGYLNSAGLSFSQTSISPLQLGTLITLIASDVLSSKMAKTVFDQMITTGQSPEQIVEEKGLQQITDPEKLRSVITAVLNDNPAQLSQYLSGNEKVRGFFVGQVMKNTGGNANPKLVQDLLEEALEKLKE